MISPSLLTIAVVLATGAAGFPEAGEAPSLPKAKFNKVLSIGVQAPEWKDLPGVDGQKHSLADFQKARVLVVVFTCNRCPVAKLYEKRLLEFAKKYAERSVAVVAISVSRNAADGLDKMKLRAKQSGLTFPYLHDETQQTGKDWGAAATPHFFVLDHERKVAYMGAFDDNRDPAKVEKPWLIDAVDALLADKSPAVAESLARGCEIEYE